MSRSAIFAVIGSLALLSAPLGHAKNDGVKGGNVGGSSSQHMSQKGALNSNSPGTGSQEKGAERAIERKSDEGLLHGTTGQNETQGKGKGQGKDKTKSKGKK